MAPTAGERQQQEEISRRTLEGQLELRQRLLGVEQERVGVLTTIEGLSLRDRDALELSVASARERLRLREAEVELEKATLTGDPRRIEIAQSRRDLVQLEEAIRRSNLGQGQAERTDVFAGIAKGFRDTRDELESFGRDGERIVRQFALTAHGFFSDLLFTPLEDDWKKGLQDTPRRLLQSVGREITDAISKFAVGNLLRGAQGLFPSLVGGATAVGGSVVAPQIAGPAPSNIGQALQAIQAAGSIGAAGATPGASLANLPISTVAAILQADGSSAASLLASGVGGPSGFSGAAGFGGPTAATLPGTSLGSILGPALGAVGGAVGLGFTLFGAVQGPPTTQNILGSALGGAISGAALASGLATLAATGIFGASIAAAAPTFGVSLVIGAIAGAALGAGAGALGKGDTGLNAQRVQPRLAIGNRVYDELGAAIQGAQTIEQAARVKIHTGNTVGGLMLQIAANNAAGKSERG